MIEVQVQRLDRGVELPAQANALDAGIDLSSALDVVIKPMERVLIPTGIALAIPAGYAGFVQPRSGNAINKGLGILNAPGLIDAGYRGEIKVIAINLDPADPIYIKRGDRIAQLVILAVPAVSLTEVEELTSSERGAKGFGSSGQ